jgi:hypothetical protein
VTSPWTDGEELTAALMYARTTAQIAALQALTADLGYITSGIVTAANGSGSIVCSGRIIGNRAWLRGTYTIGTAAVSAAGAVGTTGALTNTSVLNIVDTRFQSSSTFVNQTLRSASSGRIATHAVVTSDDTIKLCSVSGSASITAGDGFSFYGSYLLD